MRKLSISNIAWNKDQDEEMYQFLKDRGFSGVEIAPTRIFPTEPYNQIESAMDYRTRLKEQYSLEVSSMQSIWYGRTENIFGSNEERECLCDYTKKAILFAHAVGSHNLVFGCPKNRGTSSDTNFELVTSFLQEIGNYAKAHDTIFSIEPIPATYHTQFINTTKEAFAFCEKLDNSGIGVNVDLGTFLFQQEDFSIIKKHIHLVNHIHISEPMLAVLEKRDLHRKLKELAYEKYFSIEMLNPGSIETVKETINYISGELL